MHSNGTKYSFLIAFFALLFRIFCSFFAWDTLLPDFAVNYVFVYISWIESTWRQKLNCMQISNEQKKLNGNGNDYLFGDVFDFRPIFRGVYFPFLLFSSFVICLQYLLRMFFLLSIYMQSKSNLNFLQIFILIAHHLIKSNWDAIMRFKCNRIQVVCISFSLCTLCSVLLEFSNSLISHSKKTLISFDQFWFKIKTAWNYLANAEITRGSFTSNKSVSATASQMIIQSIHIIPA